MLILAGVSLNAIIGDNGVINQAKMSKELSKKIAILEDLDTELVLYNADIIMGNSDEIKQMLMKLQNKGVIDSVLCSDSSYKKITNSDNVMGIPNFDDEGNYTNRIDYSVKKDDYQIILSIDEEGIYKAEYGEINISAGGNVAGRNIFSNSKCI